MSPLPGAERTSDSGTSLPRFTRSSKGLVASSVTCSVLIGPAFEELLDALVNSGDLVAAVERAIDDVHLLLASEADEVHRVARDANGQARILLRVLHCIEQRLAIQHVHVHVIAGAAEERVEHAREVGH